MKKNFLNLPNFALNAISLGGVFFIACLGIRVVRASDIAFKVANTQLVTSNSADRLEQLANELEIQAGIIEQKEQAYQEMVRVYENSLKGKRGYEQLQNKIEAVELLPEVEDLSNIKIEISETEADLLELSEQVSE